MPEVDAQARSTRSTRWIWVLASLTERLQQQEVFINISVTSDVSQDFALGGHWVLASARGDPGAFGTPSGCDVYRPEKAVTAHLVRGASRS